MRAIHSNFGRGCFARGDGSSTVGKHHPAAEPALIPVEFQNSGIDSIYLIACKDL